jgi:hypothetical protein
MLDHSTVAGRHTGYCIHRVPDELPCPSCEARSKLTPLREALFDRPDVPATNACGLIQPDWDPFSPAAQIVQTGPVDYEVVRPSEVRTADMRCAYCNAFGYHPVERCPLVRAIDYYPSGKIRRVELAR